MAQRRVRSWMGVVGGVAAAACVAVSAARFDPANPPTVLPFSSMMTPDESPACDVAVACNGAFCTDVCEVGSVQWDPWAVSALAWQRQLQVNRSLMVQQRIGTHNAFISKANGMGRMEDLAQYLFARTHVGNASTVRIPNQRYGCVRRAAPPRPPLHTHSYLAAAAVRAPRPSVCRTC